MALSQRRARLLARLQRSRSRAREGLVLVEGVRAAREALTAGAEVSFAVASPRLAELEGGAELARRLREGNAPVLDVADDELRAASATRAPQGVLLVCREPAVALEALPAGARVLVLDAVQDPGNVGTLARCAAAFALDALVWLEGTADPWGAKAVRASAGTLFRLPVVRAAAPGALSALKDRRMPVLVADPEGIDVATWMPTEAGFALVLGNEGGGTRSVIQEAADERVAVPMAGAVDSLNVAMAGAVLLYALTGGGRVA